MYRRANLFFIFFSITACYAQDKPLLPPPDIQIPLKSTQLVREYFFENVNFSKEGKELVIIVKRPQTKLAEDLGHRLYSDTAFLNTIESEFYQDVDPSNRTLHFCGHDIYFYIKSGKNLKYHGCVNSHCGINEIGCDKLELLAENGNKLCVDSLKILDFKNLKAKEIIPDEVVYTEYISSDGIWQDYHSTYYNNCSKPNWVYDGKFQAILDVDHTTSVEVYIRQFFSHVDSLEFRNINYALEYDDEKQLHLFNNTSTRLDKLRLNVYVDKDCYHYFKAYNIEPNAHEKKKFILQHESLILIK